jgi:hypothetical protein
MSEELPRRPGTDLDHVTITFGEKEATDSRDSVYVELTDSEDNDPPLSLAVS